MGVPGRRPVDGPAQPVRDHDPRLPAKHLRGARRARREHEARRGPRRELGERRAEHLALPSPQGREVPRRLRLHGRRRGLLRRADPVRGLGPQGRRPAHQGDPDRRRPHHRLHHPRAEPDLSAPARDLLHHGPGVGGIEQRRRGDQPQGRRRGQLREPQRQRHRPVHPRVAAVRGEDGARRQPRLLGRDEGQRHRGRLHPHLAGRDPGRGPHLGERAHGLPRARAGLAAARGCGGRQAPHRPRGADHLPRPRPDPGRASLLRRQGQEPAQGPSGPPGVHPRHRHRGDPEEGHAGSERSRGTDGRPADQRLHRGAERPAAVRRREGEGAAGRGRLSGRLRAHHGLPQRPLRQRRADLPGRSPRCSPRSG